MATFNVHIKELKNRTKYLHCLRKFDPTLSYEDVEKLADMVTPYKNLYDFQLEDFTDCITEDIATIEVEKVLSEEDLKLEKKKKEVAAALEWFNSLTEEEQNFFNILSRGPVA